MLLRELFSHLVGHFRHLVGNFGRCKMKMVSGLNIARSILSKKRCSCIPFDSHMLSGNGTWQSEMEALMGKSWWNFHCYVGFPGCVHWTWDVPPPPCARRGIYKVSGGVSGGNLEPIQCSPVSGRLWPEGLLVVRPFRQAILTHGVNWTRFRSTHVWYSHALDWHGSLNSMVVEVSIQPQLLSHRVGTLGTCELPPTTVGLNCIKCW